MGDHEPQVEYGYERDTLTPGRDPIRWWVYLHGYGRPQAPRKGVRDDGFRFARGGRASTAEEAETLLSAALEEARADYRRWLHQPSHMLGPGGRLIPLDAPLPAELDPGDSDRELR